MSIRTTPLPRASDFNTQPSLDAAIGPPFIQVNGYTTVGDPITGPRNTYENAFDYSGSLSWVRGRHDLKFGGGYQHLNINVLQGIATNGFFVFDAISRLRETRFASFLFGQPVFFLQGRGDFSRGISGNSLNGYAQDTYKVTPRLTLNLRFALRTPIPLYRDPQSANALDSRTPVHGHAQCSGGTAVSGRCGRARRPDSDLQERLRAARRSRVGPDRKRKVAGDFRLWNLLRAVLHGAGRTAAVADQRSAVSADRSRSALRPHVLNFADPFNGNPPPNGTFATPLTNLTLAPNLPLPYSQDWDLNIQRSFGSDLLLEIGYVGTKGTKLPRFIEGNPAIYVPGFDSSGQPVLHLQQRGSAAALFRMHAGDPAQQLHLFLHRTDRRHREFVV